MDWNAIVFAGLPLKQVAIIAGVGIVVLLALPKISKMFAKEKTNPLMRDARCESCGWRGRASAHVMRCPKCNGSLRKT